MATGADTTNDDSTCEGASVGMGTFRYIDQHEKISFDVSEPRSIEQSGRDGKESAETDETGAWGRASGHIDRLEQPSFGVSEARSIPEDGGAGKEGDGDNET